MTILRPLKDRPLYCLFYATRHPKGIEVFRDCQVATLREQSKTRASTKMRHVATTSGQGEFFVSLHDMAPDELEAFFEDEQCEAKKTLMGLVPNRPDFITYEKLQTLVLERHVIRRPGVNTIAVRLRQENLLLFPDWEKGKRVPQPHYRVQRA